MKNTIHLTTKIRDTFVDVVYHFIERYSTIEVQVYKFANPKDKYTIGYWQKSTSTFVTVGKDYEWYYQKLIAEIICKHHRYCPQASYRHLSITPLGAQTVFPEFIEDK